MTTRPQKEDFTESVYERFINDTFIEGCHRQISIIIERTIPKFLIVGNGLVRVYDKEDKKLIDSIKELCDNYIKSNYSELIESVAVDDLTK